MVSKATELVNDNAVLAQHPMYAAYHRSLHDISLKDYKKENYFRPDIDAIDLDQYEIDRAIKERNMTMDAIIGVADYANNRIVNSRLLLVELRMKYGTTKGLHHSILKGKIDHSRKAVGASVRVDEDNLFVFRSDVAEQAKKWMFETSKEYTVSGVDSYVTSAADISADNLDSMKNEATDALDAYFANNNSYIGNSGFSYEGSYYLVAKNSDTWGDTNVLYLVFSTTVTSAENAFEPTVVYFPVKYTNIMALSDGSQSFNTYGDIEGYTDLEYDDGWDNVEGYTDGAQMFNDLVVTQKVDYTYEVTDNLTQFGN